MKFIDFNLTIRTDRAAQLLVSFAEPDGDIIHEYLSSPPLEHELEALRDKVEKDAQTTALTALKVEQALARGATTEADEKLRDVGQKLFDWIFCGRVLQAFRDKHSQARSEQLGLRIRLTIDPDDSNLGAYPFEIMFCSEVPFKDHLALFGGVTIVRSMVGYRFKSPSTIEPPLRILIVGASPKNLPQLNIKREIEHLKRALSLPGIKVESVEECTIERLRNLANVERPHVLHFIGHGEFDSESKEGKIFLVDKNGAEESLTGEELRREIANIPSLRLVTLNACQGNASNGTDLFSSVATSIFALKLPAAVVAMQFRITDLAAIEFSKCFYSQLALGRPVDDAITSARAHVRRKIKGTPEWATPVLYLGTSDGDFLGLRLPFEKLLSHSVSQLRDGNWDIAQSTATIAQEQHPDADVSAALKVITLADQCEQFSDTYLQVFKVLKRGGGDYPAATIENLVEQATKFPNEEFKQILGDDPGKSVEVIHMIEVVQAFGRGEFERVAELCEQSPAHDLFDSNLIKEQALAERAAQNDLKWVDEIWLSGDWNLAIEAVEKLSSRGEIKNTRAQQEIEKKRVVSRELRRALEALTRDDLKRAQSIMSGISTAEAPSYFELSKGMIGIGVKAVEAAESNDVALLTALKSEFNDLLSQFNQTSSAEIPGIQQVRTSLNELGSELDYQAGLDLYARGFFTESQTYFTRLGDYKDAVEKAASCNQWMVIIEKLQSRQWDEAKRLLVSLRTEDKSPRVLTYLRWCNWARMVIPVLETMAASPLVYDPLLPWEGSDNPYKLFAPLGISPTSKMEQCKTDLGFELQSKSGGMEESERKTWDMLRLSNKRLLVDFLLYSVRNQETPRSLAERLFAVEEGKELRMATTQELVSELKEDGGIFLVLRKDYDQAINFFLREAAARPYDVITLHHLGIAAAAKIHLLEEQGGDDDQLAQAWEYLILGWAAVFANDSFWHYWWSSRRRIYDIAVSSQEIQDARSQLQRLWFERIKSATDICAGLDTTFQVELNGALVVNTGKGIPLPEHPNEVAVVGFIGAKSLGLLDAVSRWTASFDSESLRAEGWQEWSCHYFSKLAEPLALFQDGRYEEAIDVLTQPRCDLLTRNDIRCERSVLNEHYPQVASQSCPCFESANPAFSRLPQGGELLFTSACDLLEKAHCKIALEAVSSTPANNAKAMTHWKIAIELARRHGKMEDLLANIRDVIVGRANFLASSLDTGDEKRCLNILNDVVELLQLSDEEKWDNDDKSLKLALLDSLLNRASFLSNQLENHEDARRDVIRAYGMEPEVLGTILIFCKVNWLYAWRLHDRGQKLRAEAILKEVEERLKEGDQLFPDNPNLASCHKDLKEIRDYIEEARDLDELLKSTPHTTETGGEQQKLRKLAEAMIKKAQKQFAEAIKLYDEILQAEPDNTEVQARMEYCYRDWIYYEWDAAPESPDKLRQITQEALNRFPNSDILSVFANGTGEEAL
ncbi:MAG TPA: CHAT domain-containing protein [Pyrinomonadaceae bacterium]|jgi:tetratricopeptide (TPR) repeat protein|nr:CHAT domain-containing protein [Pyrinomonadaceae bacterium]